MKICLVASKFPPIVGGGETYVYLLATGLAKRGHQVSVVTSNFSENRPATDIKEKNGFTIMRVDGFEDFCKGKGDFNQICQKLYSALSSLDLDIIHIHNYLPMFLLTQFRNLLKAKVVFSYHNTPYPPQRICGYFSDFNLDKCFCQQILKGTGFDLLVTGSKHYLSNALKLGIDCHKANLVYLGIDCEFFKPPTEQKRIDARKKYDLSEGAPVITLPSRIIRRKGILEAVKAIEIIREKYPKILLFLPAFFNPSDKKYAAEVKDYISKKKLSEQIIIPTKQIDCKSMDSVYAASDLVLAPSYYEGLGLIVLEAMGMGVPVIACRVSGIKEIIRNGYNGILVKPKDELQLVKAIEKILTNRELCGKMVKNGRKTVMSQFNIKQNVSNTENIYYKLLGKMRCKALNE